jgi:hypothetical protein
MERRPFWESASYAASQQLLFILSNQKFYHRHQKSPPLVPILFQIDPIHTIQFSLRSILILPTHLRPDRPSGSFLLAFPQYPLCFPFPHSCYMPFPSHSPWLHHSNYTWRRVQVTKLLIMQLSQTSCHFIPLRSEYVFPSAPSSQTPAVYVAPLYQRQSFTPVQNHRQSYSIVHSRFAFLDSRREDEFSGLNCSKHYPNSVSS